MYCFQEESFFVAVQNRLLNSAALIKERRFLLEQQDLVLSEAQRLQAVQKGKRLRRSFDEHFRVTIIQVR